jgi:hypothetical protein
MTGGVQFDPQSWTLLGTSNTESGFIIYQVPEEAQPQDLLVVGGFYSFGNAWWRLA